jgi:hypothetical protein
MKLKRSGIGKFALLTGVIYLIWWEVDPKSLNAENGILAFTALAVLWYTLETNRLAQLMNKQIELEIRPLIVFMQDPPHLRIANVGRGPALNIYLHSITRQHEGRVLELRYQKIILCAPNAASHDMRPRVYQESKPFVGGGTAEERAWTAALTCRSPEDAYSLVVDYEDVDGDSWRTVSDVDELGVHFRLVERLLKKERKRSDLGR